MGGCSIRNPRSSGAQNNHPRNCCPHHSPNQQFQQKYSIKLKWKAPISDERGWSFLFGCYHKVMKTKTVKEKPGKCYHEVDENQNSEKRARKVLS